MSYRRRLTVLTLLLLLFTEALAPWNFEVKGDGCNVSLSISPRTVYTVPHQPHKITVRWESDCSCEVRISYPVLSYVKGKITYSEWKLGGGGNFILLNEKGRFVRGFSIGKGSGSRILYLYAPDGVVGEFEIKFKVFYDGSLVLTEVLTVKADAGKPIGSISKVDPPALTLRQMHMPILLAEEGKFEVEYRLSKAAYHSVINASCSPGLNYYVTTPMRLGSKGEGRVKLFIRLPSIRRRTNPGEYYVNLTLFKRIFYYEYFEESGTYNATSYEDVLLAEATVPITVVKIPNEPYLEAKVEILDASYKIETKDNVRFNVALDLEAGYYSKKINGSKLIPPWQDYEILSGLAAPDPKFFKDNVGLCVVTGLVSEDGSLFHRTEEIVYQPVHEDFKPVSRIPRSMYALWLPQCLSADIYKRGWYVIKYLAIKESDDSWGFKDFSSSWLYKSIEELESKEFPYLKFEIVRGKIAFHHEALYNLTIYDIYLLSRSRALLVSAYVAANFKEIQHPWCAVPGHDSVEIPFTFKPPFTSVDGRIKISPNGFKVNLKKTKDGRYNLVLTIYLNASGEAKCAFSEEIRDLGEILDIHEPWCAEGYSAAWVLNATTNSKLNRLYTLPFRAITSEYRTGIAIHPLPLNLVKRFKLSKEKVGEIAIGVNLTDMKPSLHELRRVKFEGNYSLTFKWADLTRSVLESTNTLRVELTLFDWLFNKRVHEATLELDIGDAIKRALKAIKNEPPKARFEYTPKRPKPGDTVTVRSLSEDPDGKIKELKWFINGVEKPEYKNSQTISFKVEAGKVYRIRLVVVDDAGATAQYEATITVLGQVLVEVEVDVGDDYKPVVKPLRVGLSGITVYSMIIEHCFSSLRRHYRNFDNPFPISNLILKRSDGSILTGKYNLTIVAACPPHFTRFNDPRAFRDILIQYEVTVKGDSPTIRVLNTFNCWIKTESIDWSVISVKAGDEPIDVTNGFVIRARTYSAWERLYKLTLVKFLTEVGVIDEKQSLIRLMDKPKIEYGRRDTPGFDWKTCTIYLPRAEEIYALYKDDGKWQLPSTKRRPPSSGDHMDTFFHEFGHLIKWEQLTLGRIRDYLLQIFLAEEHDIHEPFPGIDIWIVKWRIRIPSQVASSIGAFEEAHSEFLATLVIEYLRCQPYWNRTTPIPSPEHTYFYFDIPFFGPTSPSGKSCHGNIVESRIAGLLLALLYGNPDLTPNFNSDAERAVSAYREFWKSCLFGYFGLGMRRWPMMGDEVLYLLFARKPQLWDKAFTHLIELNPNLHRMFLIYYRSGLLERDVYNFKTTLNRRVKAERGVIGKSILVYNVDSPGLSIEHSGGRYLIPKDYMGLFSAEKGSSITLTSDYSSTARVVVMDDKGKTVAVLDVKALPQYFFGKGLRYYAAQLVFHEDRIEVVKGSVLANVVGKPKLTFSAGSYIVIPRSSFVLEVSGRDVNLTVLEGSAVLKYEGKVLAEVKKGERVEASEGLILRVENVDVEGLKALWEIPEGGIPTGLASELRLVEDVALLNEEGVESRNFTGGDKVYLTIKLNTLALRGLARPTTLTVRWLDDEGNVRSSRSIEVSPEFEDDLLRDGFKLGIFDSGSWRVEVYEGEKLVSVLTFSVAAGYSWIIGLLVLTGTLLIIGLVIRAIVRRLRGR